MSAPPKRKATPSLPLFGDSYMADTRHLSLDEHGAYLLLMLCAWQAEGCRLPDDDDRLARICSVGPAKWRKLKPVVMGFWTLDQGWWTQRRLSHERAFVDEKRAANVEAAKQRWHPQEPENKAGEGCERIFERNAPPPPPPPQEVSKEEERESASASPRQRSPDLPYGEAIAIWTEHARACGWKPEEPKLGDKRRRTLGAILKEHGLEGWREGIERAASGALLCGPDPPAWFNFSFICKPDNFLKTYEGDYDKQFSDGSQRRSGWGDAHAASKRFDMSV